MLKGALNRHTEPDRICSYSKSRHDRPGVSYRKDDSLFYMVTIGIDGIEMVSVEKDLCPNAKNNTLVQ